MSNTVIVTPNGNVAWHLKRCEHSKEYHEEECWIPRPVFTLDEWIEELATPLLEELYQDHTLLTSSQEKTLWWDIISRWNPRHDRFNVTDKQGVPLLALADTVRLAVACWKSLRQYHALETPYIRGLQNLELGSKLWDCHCQGTNVSAHYLRQLNDEAYSQRFDSRNSFEFSNFVTWQHAFQQRCAANRWLDSAVLPSLVAAHLLDTKYADRLRKAGKLPDTIIAYGFLEAPERLTDETDLCTCTLTPQRTALLKSFLKCGCKVKMATDMTSTELYPELTKHDCLFTCKVAQQDGQKPEYRSVYETTGNEFRDVAKMVKTALLDQDKDNASHGNIGVIVPELESCREAVIQAFDEVLCPQCLLPEHYKDPRPYKVSLGQSLDRVPIVNAVLRLLRSLSEETPLSALTDTIFSPYFGVYDNRLIAMAKLNVRMRQRRQYSFTLPELLKTPVFISVKNEQTKRYEVESKDADSYLPKQLGECLRNVINKAVSAPNKRSFADWSKCFQDVLKEISWGTASNLTDDELRAKCRFLDLLATWSELDKVSSEKLTLIQAVRFLTEQAKDAIFQVRAAYKAKVQISGILEAVGLRFDRAFIMNYTDQSWPSLGAPQPFLPIDLQKTLKMPVAEDKLRQAHWVNQRLASLASNVVLSFANTSVDNKLVRKLNLSRLYNELGHEVQFELLNANEVKKLSDNTATYCDQEIAKTFAVSASTPNLEGSAGSSSNTNLENHPNDKIPPTHPETISGGSDLIQKQLTCPFSAMVAKRWNCQEWDESDDRLNALDNGTFMHTAMEIIWGSLNKKLEAKNNDGTKTSKMLSDHYDELMKTIIPEAVDKALEQICNQHNHYGTVYYELAKTRAIELLQAWFDKDNKNKLESLHAVVGAETRKEYDVKCEETVSLRLPIGAEDSEPHLELNLRLDRVDSFDDGKVISDYKTGSSYSPKQWYPATTDEIPEPKDLPPENIQLPLYALWYTASTEKEKLLGLGFDTLTNEEPKSMAIMAISGAKSEDGIDYCALRYSKKIVENTETTRFKINTKSGSDNYKPSDNITFNKLLEYWQSWANTLAKEIIDGNHPPLPGKKACKFCKYGPICRQQLVKDEDDDDTLPTKGEDC